MAIPSGSGTEVLKRASAEGVDNTTTKILDGVADHIYTILSLIISNNGSSSCNLDIYVAPSASGSVFLVRANSNLPAKGTFVFSDRIVLTGTDELSVTCNSGDHDIFISYIDQDWTS